MSDAGRVVVSTRSGDSGDAIAPATGDSTFDPSGPPSQDRQGVPAGPEPRRAAVRTWVKRRLASLAALGRSPVDASRGVAILGYHTTISEPRHPWSLDFVGQMMLIEDLGYEVVPLATVADLVRRGSEVTRPTLAITFDDGWADNLELGFPELAKRGWPASVFIPTSYLGRRPYLLPDELQRVRELGVEIENHSHTHRNLTDLGASEILEDLGECNRRLEDLTGRRPRFFCYPNGRFNPGVRDVVASSGMEAACSGRVGFNARGEDPFLLRRLTLEGGDGRRELRIRLAGGYDRLEGRFG